MPKLAIDTPNAPEAIGTYSQAVRHGNTLYLSGQIPLDPQSMEVVEGDIQARIRQVLNNLKAVLEATGLGMDDIVKLNVFLTDLGCFADVNTVMAEFFSLPYPARAAVQVAALPKGVDVEMDAIAAFTQN